MKAPINYPCVMFEKSDTTGKNLTEKDLCNKFVLITGEIHFHKMIEYFTTPVICHYYTVVNEAIRIENQVNR